MTGRSFAELIAEAAEVPVAGWDFSWLDGRATEERPPWGYQRLMAARMARASAALDIDTGGGEVLAGVAGILPGPGTFPPLTLATESWPPNIAAATRRLHPLGAGVVVTAAGQPLPFGDAAFDLVVSRHPVAACWPEIARVLQPGGTYLSQEVGPSSGRELAEWFTGPQPPEVWDRRSPERAAAAARAAGLTVTGLRPATLRMEFRDVGAVVYFLRKVIWMVPDFTVARYQARLADLHERIADTGAFVAHSTRFLIEARRPVGG